ncbi:MAG: thioesterase domain-containing protein [Burkholderiales bacterium]|nr:thioesterase domain-containing protein [Burkholderiales bacterium]
MSPSELQQYLHDHIPLSAAMQVAVQSVSPESIVLKAPLAPNINHRDTVFGGSASALCILAAWSLLNTRLQQAGLDCRLVIQRNTMDYVMPVAGDFSARSALAQPDDWPQFVRMLTRKGKGRIAVNAELVFDGQVAGKLTGEFVALSKG